MEAQQHVLGGRDCRDCAAPMLWAKWEDSGKGIPINPAPDPERGNLRLDETRGTVQKVTGVALEQARQDGEALYLTHFATCPAADSFRKQS